MTDLIKYLTERAPAVSLMALIVLVCLSVWFVNSDKVYPPLPDAKEANSSALSDFKSEIREQLWDAIKDDKTSLHLRVHDFYAPRDPLGGLEGLINSQVEGKGYEVECIEKIEDHRNYSGCTVRWDFVVIDPTEASDTANNQE